MKNICLSPVDDFTLSVPLYRGVSRGGVVERGDAVCLQCIFDTCNPSFSWSPSRFEACHPGAVCLEGQLVGGHACQMSKPLDSLLLYVVVGWCCYM